MPSSVASHSNTDDWGAFSKAFCIGCHFEVRSDANKVQIRSAIEALFDVHVLKVNTMNVKGKARRRSYRHRTGKTARVKKAIVTLAPGDQIELVQA